MTFWRKALIGAFIIVFVFAFILASLGGAGVIKMTDTALTGFFATVIGQLAAAIVAAFRTKDFFRDDPLCVARLQKEHLKEMADTNTMNAAEVESHKQKYIELEARFFQKPKIQQVPPCNPGLMG